MSSDCLLLQFLSLSLVFQHLLIPVFVKFAYLFDMGHLNLAFLVLLFADDLLSFLLIKFDSHLGKSFFGKVSLHIFTLLLPLLLVSIQDIPK